MRVPKIPRFLIRNESPADTRKWDEIRDWFQANSNMHYEVTALSEEGTDLGDGVCDASYRMIFVNDPTIIVQAKLMFSEDLLDYRTHKKYIHPLFKRRRWEMARVVNPDCISCEV